MYSFYIFSVVLWLGIFNHEVVGAPRLIIKSLTKCPSENKVPFYFNVTNVGDRQYVSASTTFPFPIDQHIGASVLAERAIDDNTYLPGVEVKEKQACKAANKYLGQHLWEYQKSVNITPKACPIPPATAEPEPKSVILIKQFEVCPSENVVKFYANLTTEGYLQYATLDLTFPWPIDENIGETLRVERSVDGFTFLPGITIREKQACRAANKYLGEAWFAAEKAAHIQPGVCPIPAGRYQINHYLLDFSKVPVEAFPPGKLKMTFNMIDKRTKKSVICLFAVAELVQK